MGTDGTQSLKRAGSPGSEYQSMKGDDYMSMINANEGGEGGAPPPPPQPKPTKNGRKK